MSKDKPGHYAILVAGQPPGWDMTALGLAMYDGDGKLVWSRFEPMKKAIDRGDWTLSKWNDEVKVPHHLPETWDDMIRTFERMGNAMSCIRWLEGGVIMTINEEHSISLYETIVQRPENE
jgi:hypothetical protein